MRSAGNACGLRDGGTDGGTLRTDDIIGTSLEMAYKFTKADLQTAGKRRQIVSRAGKLENPRTLPFFLFQQGI